MALVMNTPNRPVAPLVRRALVEPGAKFVMVAKRLMTEAEKASNEEQFLGIRISGKSDLEKYADLIEETIHTEGEFDEAPHRTFMCVGGEITNVKTVRTKKGDQMGFVNLAFGVDSYRVTMFPQTWIRYAHMLQSGKIFLFEGVKEISETYGDGFVVNSVISVEEHAMNRMREEKG